MLLFLTQNLFFFLIAVSVADATPVNPNGIKTLLANGLSTIFVKGKAVFSNSLKGLQRIPPNCNVLDS